MPKEKKINIGMERKKRHLTNVYITQTRNGTGRIKKRNGNERT